MIDFFGGVNKCGVFFLISIVSFNSVCRAADDFCLFNYKGKWGYVNSSGAVEIEPAYSSARDFSEGYAVAYTDRRSAIFIDKKGRQVSPKSYLAAEDFVNGFAVVKEHNGSFVEPKLIDKNWQYQRGRPVLQMQEKVSSGLIAVRENKWGFRTISGQSVTDFEYDEVGYFTPDGLAYVSQDGRYGYIDSRGLVVIPLNYLRAYDFSDGLAAVNYNGRWGFIDKAGRVVISFDYSQAQNFSHGLAPVKKDGKWGFVDKSGNIIIAHDYLSVSEFRKDGTAYAKNENGESGSLTTKGVFKKTLSSGQSNPMRLSCPNGLFSVYEPGRRFPYFENANGRRLSNFDQWIKVAEEKEESLRKKAAAEARIASAQAEKQRLENEKIERARARNSNIGNQGNYSNDYRCMFDRPRGSDYMEIDITSTVKDVASEYEAVQLVKRNVSDAVNIKCRLK